MAAAAIASAQGALPGFIRRLLCFTAAVRQPFPIQGGVWVAAASSERGSYSSICAVSRIAWAISRIVLRVFMDSCWILRKASCSFMP